MLSESRLALYGLISTSLLFSMNRHQVSNRLTFYIKKRVMNVLSAKDSTLKLAELGMHNQCIYLFSFAIIGGSSAKSTYHSEYGWNSNSSLSTVKFSASLKKRKVLVVILYDQGNGFPKYGGP